MEECGSIADLKRTERNIGAFEDHGGGIGVRRDGRDGGDYFSVWFVVGHIVGGG